MNTIKTIALGVTIAAIGSGSALGAVTVVNGDFESNGADFVTFPGYVSFGDPPNPPAIDGWVGTGGHGINGPSGAGVAFAGSNTSNSTYFALMQGVASLEQAVSGFIIGNEYTLSLDFNARDCCGDSPIAEVFLNDTLVGSSVDIFPDPGAIIPSQALAGGDPNTPWHHIDIPFTADAETITVKFSGVRLRSSI